MHSWSNSALREATWVPGTSPRVVFMSMLFRSSSQHQAIAEDLEDGDGFLQCSSQKYLSTS